MLAGRGAKRCRCRFERERDRALAAIPVRFQRARLEALMPRPELHPKQALVIARLREQPAASYYLFGRNGAGKTHLAWALYAHAAEKLRPVVGCLTSELIAEFRRYEVETPDSVWRPRILANDLERAERRWLIMLDELEKARPTEFAAERLFALINAAIEGGHQLVVTSNLAPERLQAHWGRIDEIWGNSIAARIAQTCTLVEMT